MRMHACGRALRTLSPPLALSTNTWRRRGCLRAFPPARLLDCQPACLHVHSYVIIHIFECPRALSGRLISSEMHRYAFATLHAQLPRAWTTVVISTAVHSSSAIRPSLASNARSVIVSVQAYLQLFAGVRICSSQFRVFDKFDLYTCSTSVAPVVSA